MVVLNRSVIKQVYVGCDWGFTNAGCLLAGATDGDGRLYIVHQVYQTQKTIDWWIKQAKEIQEHFKPSVYICDPAMPAYILQFRVAGLPTVEADNDVEAGIQAVQQRLQVPDDGRPRLVVMKKSLAQPDPQLVGKSRPTCLEEEIVSYQWFETVPGKAAKEEPVKVDDHAVDALRYLCLYLDTLGRQKVPKSKQRAAIA